jgi:hypothetical protein
MYDFVEVPSHEINQATDLYDTNPHLRAAAGIVLNAALGGGVSFQRDGEPLCPEHSAWLKQVWTQWLQAVYRQIWSVGFAACIIRPHDKYGAEPRVLVLALVRTEFIMGVDGEIEWVFTNRQTEKLIENVQVFVQDAPGIDGSLRSRVTSLMPDLAFEGDLRTYTDEGARWRAKPTLLLEPTQQNSAELEPRLLASDIFVSRRNAQTSQTLFSASSNPFSASSSPHPSAAVPIAGVPRARYEETTPAQFLLPADHKVVAAPTGGPCYLDFISFQSQMFLRVLTAWAIPPSMLLDSKGGNGRAAAGNHNITFQQSQAATKRFALGAVRTMLHIIEKETKKKQKHRKSNEQNSRKTKMKRKTLTENIVPTLPAIPQTVVIDKLYKEGVLTYKHYINHLTNTHSLPVEAFHNIPVISVREFTVGKHTKRLGLHPLDPKGEGKGEGEDGTKTKVWKMFYQPNGIQPFLQINYQICTKTRSALRWAHFWRPVPPHQAIAHGDTKLFPIANVIWCFFAVRRFDYSKIDFFFCLLFFGLFFLWLLRLKRIFSIFPPLF